jgi:hypothetical protein
MNRRWFDILSVVTVLFIIVSIILYYAKYVSDKTALVLIYISIGLFLIRNFLRMYFFIKDRKK